MRGPELRHIELLHSSGLRSLNRWVLEGSPREVSIPRLNLDGARCCCRCLYTDVGSGSSPSALSDLYPDEMSSPRCELQETCFVRSVLPTVVGAGILNNGLDTSLLLSRVCAAGELKE